MRRRRTRRRPASGGHMTPTCAWLAPAGGVRLSTGDPTSRSSPCDFGVVRVRDPMSFWSPWFACTTTRDELTSTCGGTTRPSPSLPGERFEGGVLCRAQASSYVEPFGWLRARRLLHDSLPDEWVSGHLFALLPANWVFILIEVLGWFLAGFGLRERPLVISPTCEPDITFSEEECEPPPTFVPEWFADSAHLRWRASEHEFRHVLRMAMWNAPGWLFREPPHRSLFRSALEPIPEVEGPTTRRPPLPTLDLVVGWKDLALNAPGWPRAATQRPTRFAPNLEAIWETDPIPTTLPEVEILGDSARWRQIVADGAAGALPPRSRARPPSPRPPSPPPPPPPPIALPPSAPPPPPTSPPGAPPDPPHSPHPMDTLPSCCSPNRFSCLEIEEPEYEEPDLEVASFPRSSGGRSRRGAVQKAGRRAPTSPEAHQSPARSAQWRTGARPVPRSSGAARVRRGDASSRVFKLWR